MEIEKIYNPLGNSPIYRHKELDSTMLEAERVMQAGAGHGTVVVSEYQTAGRGRGEHSTWLAEPGSSLLATVVLSPVEPLLLPLIMGLAIAEAVDEALRSAAVPVEIKWPNDVFITGRKVAGVLCRARRGLVLAGFGVNCLQTQFPEPLRATAASVLSASGVALDPRQLLPLVLRCLARALSYPDLVVRVEKRLRGRGQGVLVNMSGTPDGARLSGTLVGLDTDGALLVLPAGLSMPMRVLSGSIESVQSEIQSE